MRRNRATAGRWRLMAIVAALLLAACGGEAAEIGDALDELAAEMEQLDLEELGSGGDGGPAGEAGGVTTLQEPASLALGGTMVASFDGEIECGFEDGVFTFTVGRGAFTGRPGFEFSAGAPDEGNQVGLFIRSPGFTGESGSYEAEIELSDFPGPWDPPVEQSLGSATLTLETSPFDYGFITVAGTIEGAYDGELGSGTVSGDLGVCGFYEK